jgi:hypothetical protein
MRKRQWASGSDKMCAILCSICLLGPRASLTSVNLSIAGESRLGHLGVDGIVLARHSRNAVAQRGQGLVRGPAFVGGDSIAGCVHRDVLEGGVVAAGSGLLPPPPARLPPAPRPPPASPAALCRGEFSEAQAENWVGMGRVRGGQVRLGWDSGIIVCGYRFGLQDLWNRLVVACCGLSW